MAVRGHRSPLLAVLKTVEVEMDREGWRRG